MKPNTRSFFKTQAILVVALMTFSGCAMRQQLRYEPTVHFPRSLAHGQPLQKADTLSLIAAKDFSEWQASDFPVNVAPINESASAHSQSFQFVVTADVQIHDRGYGFGHRFARFADKNPLKPIETTERNFYQDHGDAVYLGFILNAIRQGMEQNTNLDFAIHLGDAMQFGKQSELAVFNQMIGKFLISRDVANWEENWSGNWLQTPIQLPGRSADFFNVIGNHDVMFIGNFNERGPLRLPTDSIHSKAALESALATTTPFAGTSRAVLGEGTQANGYYFSDRAMPDGKRARMIVLNTNEKNIMAPLIPNMQCGTLFPSISGEQADWLASTVRGADSDPAIACIVIFGHNQLAEITVNRIGNRSDRDATFGKVSQIVASSDKVAAYLCGHLHSGSPAVRHEIGGRKVKEIIVPSVQEFPKSFGLARIEQGPTGIYDVSIDYFNIEDVADLSNTPVAIVEDSQCERQQTRFDRWMRNLESQALPTIERMKLVAKYAYEGAMFDAAHDHRTGIDLCFHPKFAKRLAAEYAEAGKIWNEMTARQNWATLRRHLEGRDAQFAGRQSEQPTVTR